MPRGSCTRCSLAGPKRQQPPARMRLYDVRHSPRAPQRHSPGVPQLPRERRVLKTDAVVVPGRGMRVCLGGVCACVRCCATWRRQQLPRLDLQRAVVVPGCLTALHSVIVTAHKLS